MKRDSEVTTTLMKARDDIAVNWTKGRFEDGDSKCAGMALEVAAGYRDNEFFDRRLCDEAMEYFLQAIGGRAWEDIMPWNDAPERTHAEVLEAFDKAIQLSMESEG